MQFADMGRSARRALAAVTEHNVLGGGAVRFALRKCLEEFVEELVNGKPRTLNNFTKDTLFIFTDACYEPSK